jgi:hypothetical protein
MAARRWYLLIPLVLAGVGVSWLAYTQMPASYSASVAHQVKVPTPSVEPATTHRGLTLAPPPPPPDPDEQTEKAAAELVASVRPEPPAGVARGRTGVQPVTLTRQPDSSLITVRALADTAVHARDAVDAVSRQLADRLHELDEERGAPTDERMTLETSVPLAVQPPIRTVGRKVFVVTLAFCLALSLVLAAAVERTARRRRLLLAEASGGSDADGAAGQLHIDPADDAVADDKVAGKKAADEKVASGTDVSVDSEAPIPAGTLAERLAHAERVTAVADRKRPEPDDAPPTEIVPSVPAHAELDEPDAAPALAALNVGPPANAVLATNGVVVTGGTAASDARGAPTEGKIVADPDAEPVTAVIPAVLGSAVPRNSSPPPMRGSVRQRTGAHPPIEPPRNPGAQRPARPMPQGGRVPMEPRPARDAELPVPAAPAPAGVSPAARAGTGAQRPVRRGEPRREPRVQPGSAAPAAGSRQAAPSRGPAPAAFPAGSRPSGPGAGQAPAGRTGPAAPSGRGGGVPTTPPSPAGSGPAGSGQAGPGPAGSGPAGSGPAGSGRANRGTDGWLPPADALPAESRPEQLRGTGSAGDDIDGWPQFDQPGR